MERLEGTAEQLEKKDAERPWKLVEVRRQDVAGCSLLAMGWHWSSRSGDGNRGSVDSRVVEVHYSFEIRGRGLAEEFGSENRVAY